ncbi:pyruvate kinase [Methanosalsum zhilinae DSM 4017]|uniref:Pyruvate kinase n=1 Tax=Methanosalsum zhilinae (strain DSM 4017 / NBRC 107636 / OCM 62 / WeN5) TaxID=679901 RepID=F7XKA5_METZD|nr:pyruvate kinase [Methanosalsum zhilinae]AEH60574.1 pyruvate kinase [Methanosalsum zhilinae DSM 4017]
MQENEPKNVLEDVSCFKLPDHKTKIVCTLGPASSSENIIRKLIMKGMNISRLNFSHGNFQDHKDVIQKIRNISRELCIEIAIMADLPGPKIRTGKLETEPIHLSKGDEVILTTENVRGEGQIIPVNYKKLPESVSPGNFIYLNDGFIQLECLKILKNNVYCRVITEGPLSSNKGVNLPGIDIDLEPVTENDLKVIDFALDAGVDIFSISFVEKAEDIEKVRNFALKRGKSVFLIAKIEREKAVRDIDRIIEVSDGLMIARGDMGVELPIQNVPQVQKELIAKATMKGIPVITATHMLESMTENIRPTRAEVTDVANAILDGTDAVMLSGETAVGKYPVESVEMMSSIAKASEEWRDRTRWGIERIETRICGVEMNIDDVISHHVNEAVQRLSVDYVVTPTMSGQTARRISRFRPSTWILAFSRYPLTAQSLTLSYGVFPVYVKKLETDWENTVLGKMKEWGIYQSGDIVVLTQGQSPGRPGGTNLLKILTLV